MSITIYTDQDLANVLARVNQVVSTGIIWRHFRRFEGSHLPGNPAFVHTNAPAGWPRDRPHTPSPTSIERS